MANPLKRAAQQRLRSPRTQLNNFAGSLKDVRAGQLLTTSEVGKAQWKDWSTDTAIAEGYKGSSWVYVAASRIAKAASSVPWKVYDVKGEEAEEIDAHPLAELMAKPNPWMSGGDTIERLTINLYLGGNGLLTKVRPSQSGPPTELWPLPTDAMSVIPSRTEFVERYEYRRGSTVRNFAPENIVHVMFVDPSNIYWGMGPLMALARTVDTDIEAVRWNKLTLQNMGRTDGILVPHQSISQDQWEEAREQVRLQHQGADNAHSFWVMAGGWDFTPISMSPAELDFIESRKMTREEILGVYGVPPPVAGIYENATLANLEASRTLFWKDTILPYLDDLQSAFNLSLTPEFGEGIELRYDTSNVDALRENYGDKVEQAHRLWTMGYPPNAINARLELGLDAVEGGDTGYISASLVAALGEIPEEEEEVVEGEVVEELPQGEEVPEELVEGEEEEEPAAIEGATASRNGHHRKTLDPDEAKTIYWKALDRRRLGYEQALERRSKSRYREEGAEVAAAYESGGLNAALNAIQGRRGGWERLIKASHVVVVEDFGERALENIRKSGPSGAHSTKQFNPEDPGVLAWIREHAAKAASLLSQTSRDEARKIIARGVEEGLGASQIARELRGLYDRQAPARATRLARTEVIRASNYGNQQGVKQSGINYQREWIATRDERTRDTHQGADGQRVGKNEFYVVGGSQGMFPGDPMLPARETLMCRCAELFHVV